MPVKLPDRSILDTVESTYGQGVPVYMLNLIKLKDQAEYEDARFKDLPPASGFDVYTKRYLPAFNKVAALVAEGIEISYIGGRAIGVIVDPSEVSWDLVVLVKYPNIQAFKDIVSSKSYPEDAAPHRLASVSDARLIATSEIKL